MVWDGIMPFRCLRKSKKLICSLVFEHEETWRRLQAVALLSPTMKLVFVFVGVVSTHIYIYIILLFR